MDHGSKSIATSSQEGSLSGLYRPEGSHRGNSFVAINPLEYKILDTNPSVGGKEIQYPTILGADLAGTVVAVGDEVNSCKVGDRIIAHATGALSGKPEMGAFQHFVLLHERSVTLVPENVSLEAASVLPLACDTAMAGLFLDEALGLSTYHLGQSEAQPPAPNSVVLVWGGSFSIGCCAIQMANAAGYAVYATASKHNHDLCTSIGASKVFDHSSEFLEQDIIDAVKAKLVAGAIDCVSHGDKTTPSCARILAQSNGLKKIMCVLTPVETQFPGGVGAQRLSIPTLHQSGKYAIIHSWMTKALVDGSLQAKPNAKVIGYGLESIQIGIDMARKGVSTTKIVVRLC